MKIIFNLLWITSLFLFTACNDVTVGYLFTDEAAYSPDKIEIYGLEQKITELEKQLEKFAEEAGPLQAEYDAQNKLYKQYKGELDDLDYDVIIPLRDSIDKIWVEGTDDLKIAAAKERLENELYPLRASIGSKMNAAQVAMQAVQKEIEVRINWAWSRRW